MFREKLVAAVGSFCKLTPEQLDLLEGHYELLMRWNQKINLTRITKLDEVVERHYAESLRLATQLPAGDLRIADVGSGAGFPGIPIGILRPECKLTLIESVRKKAVFLQEATRRLTNFRVLAIRAEEVHENFDWVVSRAVAWKELEPIARKLAPNITVLSSDVPRETRTC